MLRCDMCGRRLKGARYRVTSVLRPDAPLTVGPECYRKTKKAQAELLARKTPEEIEALRARLAAGHVIGR